MKSLLVQCQLDGPAINPRVMLDGLLAATLASSLGLPPMVVQSEQEQAQNHALLVNAVAEILALSPCRRFFLASDPLVDVAQHEKRYIHRRFASPVAAALGVDKLRRVQLTTGLSKSYRLPMAMEHLLDGIRWFAMADAEKLRELLRDVTHIGKKRSLGCGRVREWNIQECEEWPGFPVLRDGAPLRSLPMNYEGLGSHAVENRCLMFPYWEYRREEPCAVT